ncbi:N-acetyltransferase [Taibaiella sp. KBW10]|uniref:GNAT family N-acetyltransferase n=1 Tax=Taibaiella sp. KBW10 TaxID=2153357 RepID=UPI000F5B706E|nr:GNAT family protein [Taibaiella sp. KBW10]RQO30814.1 N-acetyltransferase [Taibaiella sp. KBW10]
MTFDFEQDYTLEDERVILRPLALSDYEHLLPYALHQQDIWTYSLIQAIGEDGLQHYLTLALEGRKERREYAFSVYDKQSGTYVGSTRFYDIQLSNKSVQLGYTWYAKEQQGTGINTHCKFLLLQFAFEQMEMERVEFRADTNNARSIAAMKSIGCTVEGVLRSHGLKPDGSRRDSIVLSILKAEWYDKVKAHLQQKMNP